MKGKKGWFKHPVEHGLAAKGIKTVYLPRERQQQQKYMKELEETQFYRKSGERIAKDLKENKDKWEGFVFDEDTLFIVTSPENVAWFEGRARNLWRADEFGYAGWKDDKVVSGGIGPRGYRSPPSSKEVRNLLGPGAMNTVVIRIWWD